MEDLKETIDAAIGSGTPEGMAALADQLEQALAEIRGGPRTPAPESPKTTRSLQVIKEAWYSSAEPRSASPHPSFPSKACLPCKNMVGVGACAILTVPPPLFGRPIERIIR